MALPWPRAYRMSHQACSSRWLTSRTSPLIPRYPESSLTQARILGVSYDFEELTFAQIRGQLADDTGNDAVTVPTLKGEGYVTDSWEIAKFVSVK